MSKEENIKKDKYEAEDVEITEEDIQKLRKWPSMYIGSTDERGWHHLFQEVIDNAIDEAAVGYCSEVRITLSADQRSITIKDNGRGIPIKIHPKTKKSTLETVFTTLHSGAELKSTAYKTSGGLHGIGVTAVNDLSKSLRVESSRDGRTEIINYEQGKLVSSQIIDTPERGSGVVVEFTPDPEIFKEFTYFKIEAIQRRLKESAYLNPNLTLYFSASPTAEPSIFHFPGGLKS